jgi:hypothetical protein
MNTFVTALALCHISGVNQVKKFIKDQMALKLSGAKRFNEYWYSLEKQS